MFTTGIRVVIKLQKMSNNYLQLDTLKLDNKFTSVDIAWVELWLFKFCLECVDSLISQIKYLCNSFTFTSAKPALINGLIVPTM